MQKTSFLTITIWTGHVHPLCSSVDMQIGLQISKSLTPSKVQKLIQSLTLQCSDQCSKFGFCNMPFDGSLVISYIEIAS